MRKLRIMHLLKSDVYSGAENVVFQIIKALGRDYEFLYVAAEGPVRNALEAEAIPFELLKKFSLRNIRAVMKRFQPDIIHAHDFSASVFAACVTGSGEKLISQLHYDPPWVYHCNVKTIAFRAAAGKISRLYLVNDRRYTEHWYYNAYKNKINIVGNPVDIKGLRSRGDEQKGAGEPADLLFVGRFVPQKDPVRFVNIVRIIREKGFRHITAVMAGNGEMLEQCRQISKELGLDENIRFPGFTKQPLGWISQCRVLCMTSAWEGFGLVAIEAAALRKPVVCTKTAGTEYIFSSSQGVLQDTDQQIADRVIRLLTDEEEYRFAVKEMDRVAEKMDNYSSYIRLIDKGYREIVKA